MVQELQCEHKDSSLRGLTPPLLHQMQVTLKNQVNEPGFELHPMQNLSTLQMQHSRPITTNLGSLRTLSYVAIHGLTCVSTMVQCANQQFNLKLSINQVVPKYTAWSGIKVH